MKRLLLLTILIPLSACVTETMVPSDILLHPSLYADRTVQLCGYMLDSTNLFASSDGIHPRGGISIGNPGPLNLKQRGYVCLEGKLRYVGCNTGNVFCTHSVFDYAIDISKVFNRRGRYLAEAR